MKWLFCIWGLFLIIFPGIALSGTWELQKGNIDTSSISNIEDVDIHETHFIDLNTGWAVGYKKGTSGYGVILRTINGGESWEDISPYTHPPKGVKSNWMGERFYSVFFLDKDKGWVVGTHNTIIRTSDGGEIWKEISFDDSSYKVWRDIYMYREGNTDKGYLIGGEYKDFNYDYRDVDKGYIHKGYVYAYVPNLDNLSDLIEINIFSEKEYKHLTSLNSKVVDFQRIFYLTGYNYEGSKSLNNYGIVYRFVDSPFSKKDISPNKKVEFKGKNWSLACYLDIEIKNNNLWVVGTNNTIIFSKDNGDNWEKQKYEEKIPQENLNKICFITNNIGWAVGTTGGIYTTLNGGESWSKDSISSNYSSIKFEGICFPSFKKGWVGGEKGTILKYTQSEDIYPIKDKLFVYPNPFIPNDDKEATGTYAKGVTIENLSPGSTVKIYTISGDLVKETSAADSYGVTNWKVEESLASGLYLLIGKNSNNNSATGKMIIVK